MAGWRDRVLPDPAPWLFLEHFGLLFGSVVAWEAPYAVSQRKTHHQSNAWASGHRRCPLWDVHTGHDISPRRQRESPTWTAPSNSQVGFNNEQSARERGQDLKNKDLGLKTF